MITIMIIIHKLKRISQNNFMKHTKGDKVKLISNSKRWKDWGFNDSTIISISKSLIMIQSCQGHTMYVKKMR